MSTKGHIYVEVQLEEEGAKSEEWMLEFHYYPGFPGTDIEPPESSDAEFISAINESTKEKMSFDAFCERFDASVGAIDTWTEQAIEAVSESYEEYDEDYSEDFVDELMSERDL